MIIAVDFDGTIVTHKNLKLSNLTGEVNQIVPGAIEWLKRFVEEGASIQLVDRSADEELLEMVDWLEQLGLKVDCPTTQLSEPYDLFISVKNACCPVMQPVPTEPPFVNWQLVGPHVILKLKKGSNPWQAASSSQRTDDNLSPGKDGPVT